MSPAAPTQRSSSHPEAWRRNLTRSDPGVPWVTYYQPDTGARVELSRATFDNWVAKAAGMLAEEYDVEPGTTVLVDLEPHWLLPVWAWSIWSLGANVLLSGAGVGSTVGNDDGPTADLHIIDDPAKHAECADDSATAHLMSSRHPLGLAVGPTGELPDGVVDALADIRAYPDVRNDPIPPVGTLLIMDGPTRVNADSTLTDLLAETPIERAAILRSRPHNALGFATALLAPAYAGAALIIVDGGDAAASDAIRRQEHVDVELG